MGGLELDDWYTAFQATHNITHYMVGDKLVTEVVRIDYPDGGCYLDQEQMLLEMFSIIKDELLKRER